MDDAIDLAKTGDLAFFKEAPVDILLNARDSYDDDTVLSMAVKYNHLDCCEVICKRCPSLLFHQTRQEGCTPLHLAAYSGYLGILQLLVNACDKADHEGDRAGKQKSLTLTTSYGDNAMHKAVQGGQPESIKLLIKADPNKELLRAGDRINNTPLHLAFELKSDPVIASLLIKADPLPSADDYSYGGNYRGMTPLLFAIDNAAKHNDREMLKLIMELQPTQSMVSVNKHGWTALHYCVSKKYVDTIGYIIQSCPKSSEVANKEGQNFFRHAINLGNVEMVKEIYKACPSLIYHPTEGGHTALHHAAWKGEPEMLKFLIAAGAESYNKYAKDDIESGGGEKTPQMFLTMLDGQGDTALHKAVQNHKLEAVKLLVEADPNKDLLRAGDLKNNTALHLAAGVNSDLEIATLLVKADPDFPYGANSDGKTPLLIAIDKAELHKDREMLKLILELQPTQSKVSVNEKGWTALHYCVSKKFLDTIVHIIQSCPDSSKVAEADNEGQTCFHHAVNLEDVEMVKELYKACPSLIYHQSKGGRTALHHAAWRGEPKMLKFLITAGAKSYNENAEDDIESGGGEIIPQKKLFTMLDDQGDTALHRAVQNHKLEAVKLLVEADPGYEYGVNNSDETPVMISVREARLNENKLDSGKIRQLLLKMQPSQTMARRGEKGWTLLHQATFDGDLSSIEDIINLCPSCLKLVDNEGKNFLHIAAEWEKVEVVRQVLSSKDITPDVLNHQDKNGNTPFHIAALTGNEDLTRCFLFDPRVNKKTVNKDGQQVLRAIKFYYDKWRAGVLGIAGTVNESDLKEQRDFDLVVGALIATVSFAAGITVPGGYHNDGPNQGTAVFSKEVSFAAFIISNTFALIFSIYAVFCHFCARGLSKDADIIRLLNLAKSCTLAAMSYLMIAFIAGSFAVLAKSNWLAIVVCIISCLFFIFASGPLWMIAMQKCKRAASEIQHNHSA